MIASRFATYRLIWPAVALGMASTAHAQSATDAAAQFGALEAVSDISLSPDGANIAYIAPSTGEGNDLYVLGTTDVATPRLILRASGSPEILRRCQWVNTVRIICTLGGREEVDGEIYAFSIVIAVDATGGNVQVLSNGRGQNAIGLDFRGGTMIDGLQSDDDAILMMRSYVPQARMTSVGTRGGEGMGVDRIDVNSGEASRVEPPRRDATDYITDGEGHVRIIGVQGEIGGTGQLSNTVRYLYRATGSAEWQPLSTYNIISREGFNPIVIDPQGNRAIGFAKLDGRRAVVSIALDGTAATQTMFSHPEVDIDALIFAGSTRRVVGASYVIERRHAIVTDGDLRRMSDALSRALGGMAVHIVDASDDNSAYLIWAGADTDPGTYYLYAPMMRQLRMLLPGRPQLDGAPLATVQSITYAAADGTMIPGYLTLPPGRTDARGLPAVVMPHGGPSARDEWGFDWMAQYLAGQGFAVLQPNFRGSSGYGDAWYQNNGFQSWRTAIGDVTDGGRWLVAQGADPAKLSIVGWSYGGYAALQSGVIAPDLFKAIVAIAPVTDLAQLRREGDRYNTGRIERNFIGSGPHLREGSPAQNAAAIRAPVLMFHGDLDSNVDVEQARTMRRALQRVEGRIELVEYPGLAHNLGSSEARADMLRRIAAFLPK